MTIRPRPSRWPKDEGADRLALPTWFAALTLAATSGPLSARVRHCLMEATAAVIDVEVDDELSRPWADAVAGRELIAPDGEGQPRVVVRVIDSAAGPAPTHSGLAPGPITLAAATAAVLGVALDGAEPGVRMSAALAVEGVLIWHRKGGARRESPAGGAAGALLYAIARLDEAGSPVPGDLAAAAGAHPRSGADRRGNRARG